MRQWRHSFFVFRISISVSGTKHDKWFAIPIFVFRTLQENLKTVSCTVNRFWYDERKSKNEIRYKKSFFVFRKAFKKQITDSGATRFSFFVFRFSYAVRIKKNGLLYRFSSFVRDTKHEKRFLVP